MDNLKYYKIITNTNIKDFEAEINRHIIMNYKVHGDLKIYYSPEQNTTFFVQVLLNKSYEKISDYHWRDWE
jgi:hypothetical protein